MNKQAITSYWSRLLISDKTHWTKTKIVIGKTWIGVKKKKNIQCFIKLFTLRFVFNVNLKLKKIFNQELWKKWN